LLQGNKNTLEGRLNVVSGS